MNNELYVETKHKPVFNWHHFLRQEDYTHDELDDARDLAVNWVTCAVGHQCAIIPRDEDGWPLDKILQDRGQAFYDLLDSWDNAYSYHYDEEEDGKPFNHKAYQEKALALLLEIEQRSAELIQQIKGGRV